MKDMVRQAVAQEKRNFPAYCALAFVVAVFCGALALAWPYISH